MPHPPVLLEVSVLQEGGAALKYSLDYWKLVSDKFRLAKNNAWKLIPKGVREKGAFGEGDGRLHLGVAGELGAWRAGRRNFYSHVPDFYQARRFQPTIRGAASGQNANAPSAGGV